MFFFSITMLELAWKLKKKLNLFFPPLGLKVMQECKRKPKTYRIKKMTVRWSFRHTHTLRLGFYIVPHTVPMALFKHPRYRGLQLLYPHLESCGIRRDSCPMWPTCILVVFGHGHVLYLSYGVTEMYPALTFGLLLCIHIVVVVVLLLRFFPLRVTRMRARVFYSGRIPFQGCFCE